MTNFVGHSSELERLKAMYCQQRLMLVVVQGRQRVGKSRLIAHFASMHSKIKFWNFSGLPPAQGMDERSQKIHFAKNLSRLSGQSFDAFVDWTDALMALDICIAPGDIILFDEISWMAHKDPSFVPKLKDWWDRQQIPIMLFFYLGRRKYPKQYRFFWPH